MISRRSTSIAKASQQHKTKQVAVNTINKIRNQKEKSMQIQKPSSPINFTLPLSKTCLYITALLAAALILYLAESTYSNQIQQEKQIASLKNGFVSPKYDSIQSQASRKGNNNYKKIIGAHEVQMSLPYGSGDDKKSLSYYHCGETLTSSSYNKKDNEIILLHGAKFTKENWIESEILLNLCIKGNDNASEQGRLSVSALDLSVSADGSGLKSAFDSLVQNGILSGRPVVVITPSASGKTIVSMITEGMESTLKEIVKIWMPVASPAVIGVKDDMKFKVFQDLNIPILAMNGDGDAMGKKVTKRLVDFAGAKGVEMKGGHPCYLDSPSVFEDTVLSFIRDVETESS